MHIRHLGRFRKLIWMLLAGIPLVALSGCYPYYDGHVSGYYKQGHHGKQHRYDGGRYYHRDRGRHHKRYKHDRRKRYRHYYRY